MKTKFLLAACGLFFGIIAILTVFARPIHISTLPHVTASRVTRELFSDNYTRKPAVPKDLLDNGGVFIVERRPFNGEMRDFARRLTVTLGEENETHFEIKEGITGNEILITGSDREVNDGSEVLIVN
ncbi:MAG: hypothetical protein LBR76_05365 [Oscillospiraceae bacterium]|jgi:hypothetical protein|nr:hypothetical protein [Oscillospiraceae bacterium]